MSTCVNWIGVDPNSQLFSIRENFCDSNHTIYTIDEALNSIHKLSKQGINILHADVIKSNKFIELNIKLEKSLSKRVLLIDQDSLLKYRKLHAENVIALVKNKFALFSFNDFLLLLLEHDLNGLQEEMATQENTLSLNERTELECLIFDVFEQNNQWYSDFNLTISLNHNLLTANLRSIGFSVPDDTWENEFSYISAIAENAVIQILFEQTEHNSLLRQYLSAVCEKLGSGRSVNINYTSKTLRELVTNIEQQSYLIGGVTTSSIQSLDSLRILIFIKPE
ncbi:hypothetical protein UA32_11930 [Photobacterium angustum]|uniref:Uncharacterized protein n=1 Tax=Photobacterium angustum TaxID=661 RepID=A0ABX5GYN8_PHOAN|nr:hypothetical protein [Photobacterium angustum]KJG37666.1 hypothetical protein UA32_11930 [Photobacterium angustum]PSX01663.1 hypothetical protein C0W27_21995 [Photobacterium angustum]